jgi:hypothetical protein
MKRKEERENNSYAQIVFALLLADHSGWKGEKRLKKKQ